MAAKPLLDEYLSLPETSLLPFLENNREAINTEFFLELGKIADEKRLENAPQAMLTIERMQTAARWASDERAYATALRIRGSLLVNLGEYQNSIAAYSEAKAIWTRLGEPAEAARLQVGWTAALKNLARYTEALALGLATKETLTGLERWDWLASLELNLGSIYRLTDHYTQALETYQDCQEHFRKVNNPVGVAQAQINTARVLCCLDQFREAQELLRVARAELKKHHKALQVARADLNLATISFEMGQYRQAWESYQSAWEGFKSQNNAMEMAVVDLYLAQVLLALNQYAEASEHARRAGQVFSQLEMGRYVALANYTLAVALRSLGQLQEAYPLLEKAQAFFADHQGESWSAMIALEQAHLLLQRGQALEAAAAAQAAADTFERFGMHTRSAQARLLLADCHRKTGQTEQARVGYRSILSLPPRQQQAALVYRAHHGLGRLEEGSQRLGLAYRHYRAAIRQIEIIQRALRVDEFKASFLDDKFTVYEDAVRLCLDRGKVEEALSYVERYKSSLLLDFLVNHLEFDAPGGSAEYRAELERLGKLREAWTWHHSQVDRPSTEEEEGGLRGGEKGEQAWGQVRQLESQIRRALRKLQGHRVASLGPENPEAWLALVPLLNPGEMLVEYFCTGDAVLAFLISDQGVTLCREFPYSMREVKRSLGVLELSLKNIAGLDLIYVGEVLAPIAQRHLRWFYQALIEPLLPWIRDARKLVFLPHDALYALPFHACYDGQRYLIEQFEVSYAPSAAILARCLQIKPPAGRPQPALVMGYSNQGHLKFTADEVRSVASQLADAASFEEDRSTLLNFRQHVEQSRVIHIASHAVFRSDNPLFSYFQLADGQINVIDLYHLSLHASLVTLSGCATGISQLKGGDLYGLVRGCLYAGAPSLVVSLWQVNDVSTALLMGEFYQRLKQGETFAAALRRAMLALKNRQEPDEGKCSYNHPQYWAPFCLMGADGRL